MVTIGVSKWPLESGKEVGKRSLEMKPLPDFINLSGPYMYPDENDGIVSIAIFKYGKEKAGEAAEEIAKLFMVYNSVPGFCYSTKLASGSAATLKMMGLK